VAVARDYVAPRNDTERRLVAIWAEVLNRSPETIGVNDNFFELGGHSLSAVRLTAKINMGFGRLLPLAVMFTAPNIAALATLIASEEAEPFKILVPIQTNGTVRPVFGVPGAGGNVVSLQPLSRALGRRQPFYGLQAVGLDGQTRPLDSVEQTARANIAALKAVQPLGPYSLIGHSYGGVVAYEMARVLLEQGDDIASLTLLDTRAPSVMQGQLARDEADELVEACTVAAGLNGIVLDLEADQLRQLPDDAKIQYIGGLLHARGIEGAGEQFAAFYKVYRANLLCYRDYVPRPLSRAIDVSLYRATQTRDGATPRDYGWSQLLRDQLRIHDVEANHHSILEKADLLEMAGASFAPPELDDAAHEFVSPLEP